MPANALGNELDWEWTMNKTNSVLSISVYDEGVKRGAIEFEIPQGLTATRYEDGDIYFDREEILLVEHQLRLKTQEPGYASRIAQKVLGRSRAVAAYVFDEEKHKDAPLQELASALKHEAEAFFWMMGYMSYRGSIQMSAVIGERIEALVATRLAERGRITEMGAMMRLLQEPLKPSIIWEEKAALLRAAAEEEQDIAFTKHIATYGWLGYHWFQGAPTTKEQLLQRLADVTAPTAALQRMEADRATKEARIEQILDELSFSVTEKTLLEEYRHWIFLRTFVKDQINLAAYKLLPLLRLIGQRIGWGEREMPWLTFQELHSIHEQDLGTLARRVAERKLSFGATLTKDAYEIYSPARPLKRALRGTAAHIKGQTAYPGIVEGIARVLQSPKEAGRVRRGDILVTSMTTPDYLPAMERAAAFVTDEGGITCHAAIVARELKKPCVIGTGHAKELIKDGDRVLVDAERGVIAILAAHKDQ